ncbi:Sulfite exporter TauE/SafE [Anatilimnocola aggregata]|uniref:Probable membrane transporter protein n=1 Tax=Anatilimnocola aggregata TaxID=2528021 RepID=A0A517YE69_9BACT|nr:Sulfite exporter TauE/SafE [Anatilimnocola aggregata]
MQWSLLFLFGVGIGVLSGMLGIGGGVVLVPGLILLFGFSQAEAQGTSLAVMIPPIGIFAALVYYQHGFVRLPVVGLIALGFMVGAFFGAKLVPHLPLEFLRVVFGVLLLYLGFAFVLSPRGNAIHVALPAGIATAISCLAAYLLRYPKRDIKPPQRPSDQQDYHI